MRILAKHHTLIFRHVERIEDVVEDTHQRQLRHIMAEHDDRASVGKELERLVVAALTAHHDVAAGLKRIVAAVAEAAGKEGGTGAVGTHRQARAASCRKAAARRLRGGRDSPGGPTPGLRPAQQDPSGQA